MKHGIRRYVALLLSLILLIGSAALTAAAATADQALTGAAYVEDADVIYVSAQDVENYGFRSAVQSALDSAASMATAELPITVAAPAGSYNLNGVLRMYNNTTLDLRGVTLTRSGSGNMLRVGSEDGVDTGVTGYPYENIRLIGGTFDGNGGTNTIIKAFHTKSFTMEDVTLLNEKDGHMMEFAGVDGLTIRGCTFKNQILTPGKNGYEVIQLDVLHPYHITNGRCEDLPIENVLIENCTFDNVPRGVGSHTAVHNRPHSNITIKNNRFTNLGSIAIQGMGWVNVDIVSNYIDNAPRGITVMSEPYGCTYLSSKLASKGGTASHVSDSYIKPSASNINIAYNTLKNIGTAADGYASYSSQGIAVLGEKLTSKSAVDSSDESGGLPAGDYYIDGANIHDNYIDVRGNGVRVEDARNIVVRANEILCSKNTVKSDNYYGIVLRDNVYATSVIFNTIKNAEVNGIQIDTCTVTSIERNRVESTGKYGIGIYDSTIGVVNHNDILKTSNIGLFMSSTTAKEVKKNRIRNCSEEGIWITSDSKSSLVENNTTVNNSGTNSYGGSTVKTNYTSGGTLKSFVLPWYFSTPRAGARMGVGTAFKIVPDVSPANSLASFTYKSSNSAVASVDGNGLVFAKKEGSATITVTSDNNISKTYPVTVTADGGVEHLETAPTAPVLILGDADASGEVDTIDATFVQRHLAYIATPYSTNTLLHGDADQNGVLELTDVSFIQRYLVGLSVPYAIGKKYS